MKRIHFILALLLTSLLSTYALAQSNPCAGETNGGNKTASTPCTQSTPKTTSVAPAISPTTSSTNAMLISIQDDAQTVATAIAANAPPEPRRVTIRDNIYFNAIFWLLATLAPLGALMMIVLNLMEYRQRRADEIEQ
ncbi:hypothetical protein AAKU61_003487 [Undibacterium sp. GrIS 1.2]|uniref:hypothetical protein n=1 Tax=Undibacterium sp. GrIS 1.2 TaxID=3143933 RepID=UPI003390FA7E